MNGYTYPIRPPQPATMAQLRALFNLVASKSPSPQRDNAMAALGSAMECLNILADAETYDRTPCPTLTDVIDWDNVEEVPF